MQSDDLTAEQFAQMRDAIGRQRNYLGRLIDRMDAEHFHPLDPLYKRVKTSFDAAHDLWVHLHYRACGQVTDSAYPRDTHTPATAGDVKPVQNVHARFRNRRRR
jgi:hypothetical protein